MNPFLYLTLFALNISALGVYEFLSLKKIIKRDPRWLPRIFGLAALLAVTVSAMKGIVSDFPEPGHILNLILALGFCIGAYFVYSRKIRDLLFIANHPN